MRSSCFQRVGLVEGKADQPRRHAVAELSPLRFGANAHGCLDPEVELLGTDLATREKLAEGPGHHGQDDVVDRAVESAPQRLHIRQRHAPPVEKSMRPQVTVDGRRRGVRQLVRDRVPNRPRPQGDLVAQVPGLAPKLAEAPQRSQRQADPVTRRVEQQLAPRRLLPRDVTRALHDRAVGGRAHEDLGDVDP